jgi:hypothetical protein
MPTTEFPINLDDDNEGLGETIITDAQVLIRPAVTGQYPGSVKHDSVHAYRVLYFGNDMDRYEWHIFSRLDPESTHRLLDRVFYAYVDACCLQLWCDARVNYVVGDEVVKTESYGFDDGQYTQHFRVHCNTEEDQVDAWITAHMATLGNDTVVVVRPDSSEFGYSAHGFIGTDEVTGDDQDDYDNWPEEDEDPLAGDIDDGSHYVPEPGPLNTQHYFALKERGYI